MIIEKRRGFDRFRALPWTLDYLASSGVDRPGSFARDIPSDSLPPRTGDRGSFGRTNGRIRTWLAPVLCYGSCVTEHISIRPRRPGLKADLVRVAKPNLNAWLNDLIEGELAARPRDWREILERERLPATEEAFQQCLRPE